MSETAEKAWRFARQHGGEPDECVLEVYLTGFVAAYGSYTGSETEVGREAAARLFNGYRGKGYSPQEALDEVFLDGFDEGRVAKVLG